jgi:hypothetical protein
LTASFSLEKEPKEKEIDRYKGRKDGRKGGRKDGKGRKGRKGREVFALIPFPRRTGNSE